MNPSKIIKIGIVITAIGLMFNNASTIQRTETNLKSVGTVSTNGINKYDSMIRLETSEGAFYCSGVVIDGTYALTAAHCVVNSFGNISIKDIAIYDSQGVPTGVIAKAAAIDTLRDVALIKGDFTSFKFAPVDFQGDDVKLNMILTSCGFPSGEKLFCTDLIHVGNYNFQYRTTGGPIFKGMSGGGVFNKLTGRVIGINSAVTQDNVIVSPLVGFLGNVGI